MVGQRPQSATSRGFHVARALRAVAARAGTSASPRAAASHRDEGQLARAAASHARGRGQVRDAWGATELRSVPSGRGGSGRRRRGARRRRGLGDGVVLVARGKAAGAPAACGGRASRRARRAPRTNKRTKIFTTQLVVVLHTTAALLTVIHVILLHLQLLHPHDNLDRSSAAGVP